MNTNTTKQQDPQVEAEAKASQRLLNGMSAKAKELQDKYGAKSLDEFHLEPLEKSVLQKINNFGFVEGWVAGMITILALRQFRSYLFRRVQQQAEQYSASHGHSPSPMQRLIQQQKDQQVSKNGVGPFAQNSSSSSSTSSTAGSGSRRAREGPIAYWVGWAMDGLFGTCVGVYVMVKMVNIDKVIESFALLPLAPGKSTLCREFCPVAVDWMKELQAESEKGDEMMKQVLTNTKTPTVTHLLTYAKNCDLRLRYEQTLRKEKGVTDPLYRVEIPPPGVPLDFDEASTSAFSSSSALSSSSEWGEEGNDFTDRDDSAWANGFVEDQEESNRRKK